MDTIVKIALMAISAFLILVILLQSRGTGLSGVLGGEGNVYRTKRGVEKTLYGLTILLAIIFFSLSIANLLF